MIGLNKIYVFIAYKSWLILVFFIIVTINNRLHHSVWRNSFELKFKAAKKFAQINPSAKKWTRSWSEFIDVEVIWMKEISYFVLKHEISSGAMRAWLTNEMLTSRVEHVTESNEINDVDVDASCFVKSEWRDESSLKIH